MKFPVILSAALCAILFSSTVIAAPVADFTFVVNCADVTFTDQSTDSAGTIVSWLWNFGDGDSSSTQNPFHVYSSGGNYDVTLIATNNSGASDTVVKNINVGSPSFNSISVSICDGDSVFAGGSWQYASGIYYDTLLAAS